MEESSTNQDVSADNREASAKSQSLDSDPACHIDVLLRIINCLPGSWKARISACNKLNDMISQMQPVERLLACQQLLLPLSKHELGLEMRLEELIDDNAGILKNIIKTFRELYQNLDVDGRKYFHEWLRNRLAPNSEICSGPRTTANKKELLKRCRLIQMMILIIDSVRDFDLQILNSAFIWPVVDLMVKDVDMKLAGMILQFLDFINSKYPANISAVFNHLYTMIITAENQLFCDFLKKLEPWLFRENADHVRAVCVRAAKESCIIMQAYPHARLGFFGNSFIISLEKLNDRSTAVPIMIDIFEVCFRSILNNSTPVAEETLRQLIFFIKTYYSDTSDRFLTETLEISADIFAGLGQRLDLHRVVRIASQFGFDDKSNIRDELQLVNKEKRADLLSGGSSTLIQMLKSGVDIVSGISRLDNRVDHVCSAITSLPDVTMKSSDLLDQFLKWLLFEVELPDTGVENILSQLNISKALREYLTRQMCDDDIYYLFAFITARRIIKTRLKSSYDSPLELLNQMETSISKIPISLSNCGGMNPKSFRRFSCFCGIYFHLDNILTAITGGPCLNQSSIAVQSNFFIVNRSSCHEWMNRLGNVIMITSSHLLKLQIPFRSQYEYLIIEVGLKELERQFTVSIFLLVVRAVVRLKMPELLPDLKKLYKSDKSSDRAFMEELLVLADLLCVERYEEAVNIIDRLKAAGSPWLNSTLDEFDNLCSIVSDDIVKRMTEWNIGEAKDTPTNTDIVLKSLIDKNVYTFKDVALRCVPDFFQMFPVNIHDGKDDLCTLDIRSACQTLPPMRSSLLCETRHCFKTALQFIQSVTPENFSPVTFQLVNRTAGIMKKTGRHADAINLYTAVIKDGRTVPEVSFNEFKFKAVSALIRYAKHETTWSAIREIIGIGPETNLIEYLACVQEEYCGDYADAWNWKAERSYNHCRTMIDNLYQWSASESSTANPYLNQFAKFVTKYNVDFQKLKLAILWFVGEKWRLVQASHAMTCLDMMLDKVGPENETEVVVDFLGLKKDDRSVYEELYSILIKFRSNLITHAYDSIGFYIEFLSKANDVEESRILSIAFRIGKLISSYARYETFGYLKGGIVPRLIKLERLVELMIPQLFASLFDSEDRLNDANMYILSELARVKPHLLIFPAAELLHTESNDAAEQILDVISKIDPHLANNMLKFSKELSNISVLPEELLFQQLMAIQHDFEKRVEKELRRKGTSPDVQLIFASVAMSLTESLEKILKIEMIGVHRNRINGLISHIRRLVTFVERNNTLTASKLISNEFCKLFRVFNEYFAHNQVFKLTSLSPYLAKVNQTGIPLPSNFDLSIVYVHGEVRVLPTKTKPKQLKFCASDGRQYTFLLKGMEDLHLDERMMQIIDTANMLLAESRSQMYLKRELKAVRYAVTPITSKCGLIEFVDNTTSYFSLFRHWQKSQSIKSKPQSDITTQEPKIHELRPVDYYVALMNEELTKREIVDKYPKLSRKQIPDDALVGVFERLTGETPHDLLSRELKSTSTAVSDWIHRKLAMTESIAVMSMIGYLIGLGDRHTENILFNFSTAEVVHIDFNVCFDKGRTSLRIPEVVPFRVSGNMAPFVNEYFKCICIEILKVLRSGKDLFLSLMETFLYDPLMDWRSTVGELNIIKKSDLQVNLNLLRRLFDELGDARFDGMFQTLFGHEAGGRLMILWSRLGAQQTALNNKRKEISRIIDKEYPGFTTLCNELSDLQEELESGRAQVVVVQALDRFLCLDKSAIFDESFRMCLDNLLNITPKNEQVVACARKLSHMCALMDSELGWIRHELTQAQHEYSTSKKEIDSFSKDKSCLAFANDVKKIAKQLLKPGNPLSKHFNVLKNLAYVSHKTPELAHINLKTNEILTKRQRLFQSFERYQEDTAAAENICALVEAVETYRSIPTDIRHLIEQCSSEPQPFSVVETIQNDIYEPSKMAIEVIKRVKEKLEGRDYMYSTLPANQSRERMTAEQQFEMLFKAANDPLNLARMYEGWMSWM